MFIAPSEAFCSEIGSTQSGCINVPEKCVVCVLFSVRVCVLARVCVGSSSPRLVSVPHLLADSPPSHLLTSHLAIRERTSSIHPAVRILATWSQVPFVVPCTMHSISLSSRVTPIPGGGEKESFIKFHGDDLACSDDNQLAQEYAKLQHRFVHWQEQLVHNQQVLHQRVAPLAGTKPLHSVGVLREILSQSSEFSRSDKSHDSTPVEQENLGKYGHSTSPNHLQELPQSSCTTLPPRQSVCVGNEEPSTEAMVNSSLDHRRSQQLKANDIPAVPLGAWTERPSEPLQFKKVTRTLSSAPQKSVDEGTSRIYPTVAQPFAKPLTAKKPQFLKPRKDKQFGSNEAINPHIKTERESAAFWKELQARRIDLGLQNEETEEPVNKHSSEAFYPRNNLNIAPQESRTMGQSQDPSHTVHYSSDRQADRSVADISDSSAQRNPRYTSVVTLAAKNEGSSENTNGVPSKSRDKVRSIVQLGNSSHPPSTVQHQQKIGKGMVPVVRGFRQTDSDQGVGQTFHSRIIANALGKGSSGAAPSSSSVGSLGMKNPVTSTSSTFLPSGFTAKNNTNPTTKGNASVPVTSTFVARNNSAPAINSSTTGKYSSSSTGSDFLTKSSSTPDSAVNSHLLRDYRPSLTSKVTATPSASYEVPAFNQSVPSSSVHSSSYQDSSVAMHNDNSSMFPSSARSKLVISNNSVPPPPPPPPLHSSLHSLNRTGSDVSQGLTNSGVSSTGFKNMDVSTSKANVSLGSSGQQNSGERRTASGKRIVAPKTAPKLDPREELMLAIRQFGGSTKLRPTKT